MDFSLGELLLLAAYGVAAFCLGYGEGARDAAKLYREKEAQRMIDGGAT